MPELNWQIADETAKIGEFHCQKAMVNYGGRNWTAWFTKDIALAEGPYYFYGLPGLILKISDVDDNFVFSLSSLKKYEGDSLYLPKGGKVITWKQYQQLQQQLYDDPMFAMRSMGISKLSKNDGSGGSIPMNQSELIGNIRKTLITNNNPIELDQKVDFK
ncbi:hypothetical protein ASG01_04570 [Chryseobacterium sp. Leaf180]|nr:hypothetical protein ASG01_04570 [Chryseobacterium sp. Leaf180]